jgi:NAD(P)-dependent dehydrogenase (short-subunit alcohol dehydrogenase family)
VPAPTTLPRPLSHRHLLRFDKQIYSSKCQINMVVPAFHRTSPIPNDMALDFGVEFEESVPKIGRSPKLLKMDNASTLTKHRDTYSFIDPYRFKNKLSGKVVLITQAHRGIGRSTAVAFAQAGASVCCVGPTASSLEALLLEIKEKWNTPTLALATDLTSPQAPAQLVELVEKHRGPIDILINITPAGYLRPFFQERDIMEDWWPHMEVSVRTPIALIHAVLPSMVARKTGIIISTTIASGVVGLPFMSADSVAKASLIKFHQHLDLENREKGVLSFAVNPGPVPSHIHDPSMPIIMDPEHLGSEPMHVALANMASSVNWAAAGLASGTFLTLCAEPRAAILSGLYVNAERDLEELIGKIEKDNGRRVERDRLYVMKVDEY